MERKGRRMAPICAACYSVTDVLLKGSSPVALEHSVGNKPATPGLVVLRWYHLEKGQCREVDLGGRKGLRGTL